MKFLPSQLAFFLGSRDTRRNLRLLRGFLLFLTAMVVLFTVAFHLLMAREGQDHSWLTGFYWTLTVMSTLGFGDITFQSDAGRLFSIVVLLSGVIFLLVVVTGRGLRPVGWRAPQPVGARRRRCSERSRTRPWRSLLLVSSLRSPRLRRERRP